jgi:hypothetical protein
MRSLLAEFTRWLAGNSDEVVLQWLYRSLLVLTVIVLMVDYSERGAAVADSDIIPSFEHPRSSPLPEIRHDNERGPRWLRELNAPMQSKMTFELLGDGKLLASGTIFPGTAAAFAGEIAKRGSYVKMVTLQSPGGSVWDAMEMGRLIRAKGFSTEVEDKHYCASACPLVFAGGVTRHAAAQSAIGVHQAFAVEQAGLDPSDGMANGQRISAAAQSYLRSMGVDLGVWVHAMETPKDRLYYFTSAELLDLRLATDVSGKPKMTRRELNSGPAVRKF